MKAGFLFISFLLNLGAIAQTVPAKLAAAIKKLEADEQFKHAMLGMQVVESNSGKVVFEKNSQTGLAPASCQKIITSVSAFELLGRSYQYKTSLGYEGKIGDKKLTGNLYLIASGDPTLGSWRYGGTSVENITRQLMGSLKKAGIDAIEGDIIIDDSKWESQGTPRGWIWEDVGNYFGAGARGLNWHENQYDLKLRPGQNVGDSVAILSTEPELQAWTMINELKTGPAGSGDRSVIYLPEEGLIGYLRGTIPAGNATFTISGSIPNPAIAFEKELDRQFYMNQLPVNGRMKNSVNIFLNKEQLNYTPQKILELVSPTLDSINYWFLKKSINLYGEALVKTIAYEKKKFGATDSGLAIINDFWAARGIEPSAMNILDGSGLSPANRVTTQALVTVLQYARKQSWFPSFYNALPEMNGIKMKDGYIGGVRSYTGYVKDQSGKEYSFSLIVNNFSGSPSAAREKIWKLLDILK